MRTSGALATLGRALCVPALAVGGVLILPASISQAQQNGYVARVLLQIDQVIDAAAMQGLTAADRARIEQGSGARFVDAERVLRFPPKPVGGYWLKVGTRRYRVSEQGLVRVPTRPSTTQKLKLYAQVGDTRELVVLPSVTFVPEPQVPPPTIVKVTYTVPRAMNPKEPEASASGPGGPSDVDPAALSFVQGPADFPSGPAGVACRRIACVPGNGTPCCRDYDGLGDGVPVNRNGGPLCAVVGYLKFLGSTCFMWTFENFACFNESALYFNNLNPNTKAPNCYLNHKYRNCQNLNMYDLNLTASKTEIKFGESVTLKLRNNTPGNFTCLAVDTPTGASPPSVTNAGRGGFVKSGDCGGYRAAHFSDAAKKHYEDMTLRFKAPAKAPKGTCDVLYKLTATNGGLGSAPPFDTWITVRKADCSGEWAGWVKLVYTESGSGDQPLKFRDQYEERQTWTIVRKIGPAAGGDIYDATWDVRADGEATSGEGCNTDVDKIHDGTSRRARLSISELDGVLQVRFGGLVGGDNGVLLQKQLTTSRNVNCVETTDNEPHWIHALNWGNDIRRTQPGGSFAGSKVLDARDPSFGWLMLSNFSGVTKRATLSWSLTRIR